MNEKKVLLSIKNLEVQFKVRGRVLTAIRGIDLDIYENESIAIVGESGSGKSVFTKTFAGMLDSNGYISAGDLFFNDEQLADTVIKPKSVDKAMLNLVLKLLDRYSKLELGSEQYNQIQKLKAEKRDKFNLGGEECGIIEKEIADAEYNYTEAYNYRQTLTRIKDYEEYKKTTTNMRHYKAQVKQAEKHRKKLQRQTRATARGDKEYLVNYKAKLATLKKERNKVITGDISDQTKERNKVIGKEIFLSLGRYSFVSRIKFTAKLLYNLRKAMKIGVDLTDEEQLNKVFDTTLFRVKYLDGTTETQLHGTCALNLAKIKFSKDWQQIRGSRIATVFQDPMTSLNPIITIGKQISSVIMKHQHVSPLEARRRAVEMMKKVGIPDAENRYDDYPFQYSGGMRQRIVIAIALACQPKILICDEPTTALDVTIQAQILRLIKSLQKEFGYTIVFITHDLGVVANIADRVAVLYAGQIVELGNVEEVFYDPQHPYTWALLSSLPQLAQKNTELYSIAGTPPSLYNKITGDPFAPRNPYCMRIDTLKEPPMFQVSETHYAKTWLLDPRAPKTEKPEIIRNIHGRLIEAFNIQEVDR